MQDLPAEIYALSGRVNRRNSSMLLSCKALGALAESYGLGWFTEEHIRALWNTAILRADVVVSKSHIDSSGFTLVSSDDQLIYADSRRVTKRDQGHGSSPDIDTKGRELELFFHPFRIFVLYHVDRTLTVSTSSTQYLMYKEGVAEIAAREVHGLDHWTSSDSFGDRFRDWNVISEVASLLDTLWKSKTRETEVDPQDYAQVLTWIGQFGELRIRDFRGELGRAAELLDENRHLHVLIRLMSPYQRSKIKGRLGASMQCLYAAEAIRRIAEESLGKQLPEEDEIGFGTWLTGARQMIYGTTRVFDAPRSVLRDYLTSLGIDFGIKARCYGEGPTECGAISAAFPDSSGIELIDLKGDLLKRKGKVLQFSDALRRDHQSGIFSIVLIDADRQDAVRALKAAAASIDCFPVYFVAEPDFELANFSLVELLDIALGIECKAEIDQQRKECLRDEITRRLGSVTSAAAFFELLLHFNIRRPTKGTAWGNALMFYALSTPRFLSEHHLAGRERPVISAARMVERALRSGYARSLQRAAIDPSTGQPVAKK
ncbi:hypothetical protein [Methylibium petroleiphilum]|uniref:hypothetical protein n=1 Tax=Methylibium petroleiphilum TaxID=105560 RepID=UPI003D27EEF1